MSFLRVFVTILLLTKLNNLYYQRYRTRLYILISNIIQYYWKLGRSLSIEDLIINIQKPPIKKMGIFEIDQLMDEKERTELSFKINNIVASPSFKFWSTGVALSVETLFKSNKKIPVNIFYIAHLMENERMFFVTLLLNEVVFWMRTQPGSGNLKYLLYMDEIFGYLPPYPQNPPSKEPLMILLKQARAFGLGVVLATQNTKDIDYKALTNMGTWFVGKLQAEGDRERVMEGLTGIALESGERVENSQLKEIFAALGNRKFLAKDVHSKGIKTFQTRWAMSFLAGPLTREQIKSLTKEQKQAAKKQEVELSQPTPKIKKSIHLLPYVPQPEIPMESIYDNSGAMQGYYSPFLHLDGEIIFDEQHLGLYIRKKYFATAPLKASINWREASIYEEPIKYSDEPTENIEGYEPLKIKLNYSLLRRLPGDGASHLQLLVG